MPVNVAVYVLGTAILPVTSRTPVPVKVGCETVPEGVKLPVEVIVAAVPVKAGAEFVPAGV